MKLHLHQFLSRTGKFNGKREIENAIEKGEISLDDAVIVNRMYRFNPEKKKVKWKEELLKTIETNVYYILNKPTGYVSTRLAHIDVINEKKSVFELIDVEDNIKRTLFAVGRLDEDSSGLLIITNDGKLGYRITNPNSMIKKTYFVVLAKSVSEEQIKKVETGVIINLEENGVYIKYKTKPCKIKVINDKKLLITLTEGKKREVRRIFDIIENKVLDLERISIDRLNLKDLNIEKGEFKEVSKSYIKERLNL